MKKLHAIQILRGLAAMSVVIFHAREEIDAIGRGTRIPPFVVGAFGVDLFFVISGFVMVYASARMFGHWRSIGPFLSRRIIRIVPLYWAITLPFAAYVALDPGQTGAVSELVKFLAYSLAFLNYVSPNNDDSLPIYPLGWTLNYEMAFYFCFAMVIALPRRRALATLVAGFTALVGLNATVALPNWLSYLASTQILEFAGGAVLSHLVLEGRRLPPAARMPMIVTAIVMAVAATRFTDWLWPWRGFLWGLPACLIVGALSLIPMDRAEGRVSGWLERLGDASYALYLTHYALFVAIEGLLGRVGLLERMPSLAFILVLIGCAVPTAFAVHRWFEVPVTRALQRLILSREIAPSAVPA